MFCLPKTAWPPTWGFSFGALPRGQASIGLRGRTKALGTWPLRGCYSPACNAASADRGTRITDAGVMAVYGPS